MYNIWGTNIVYSTPSQNKELENLLSSVPLQTLGYIPQLRSTLGATLKSKLAERLDAAGNEELLKLQMHTTYTLDGFGKYTVSGTANDLIEKTQRQRVDSLTQDEVASLVTKIENKELVCVPRINHLLHKKNAYCAAVRIWNSI